MTTAANIQWDVGRRSYLLRLRFGRQRCDQVDGGVLVLPVLLAVLGVLAKHGADVAGEDGGDGALEELAQAPHQVARCPAAGVDVCG